MHAHAELSILVAFNSYVWWQIAAFSYKWVMFLHLTKSHLPATGCIEVGRQDSHLQHGTLVFLNYNFQVTFTNRYGTAGRVAHSWFSNSDLQINNNTAHMDTTLLFPVHDSVFCRLCWQFWHSTTTTQLTCITDYVMFPTPEPRIRLPVLMTWLAACSWVSVQGYLSRLSEMVLHYKHRWQWKPGVAYVFAPMIVLPGLLACLMHWPYCRLRKFCDILSWCS